LTDCVLTLTLLPSPLFPATTTQGYLVHVAGRDVDIGRSTCSLFCFTLARAMLADTIDCTCNDALAAKLMPPGNVTADISDTFTCSRSPVMCSINAYAFSLYKSHMKPALVAVVVCMLCVLAMLCLLSGTTARVSQQLQAREALSRSSSTDADLRVSTGDSSDVGGDKASLDQPRKACGKVCSFV
jgi:hypothetical protein